MPAGPKNGVKIRIARLPRSAAQPLEAIAAGPSVMSQLRQITLDQQYMARAKKAYNSATVGSKRSIDAISGGLDDGKQMGDGQDDKWEDEPAGDPTMPLSSEGDEWKYCTISVVGSEGSVRDKKLHRLV
ncbi:hypothetical protein FA95DRAFT_1608889 [Auriscalpium vulgare]|uniref:Uncharacterized protein n=1 Tax=Auriscalpium vulgare TaxID=40419 RepID=A0ACB8RJI3_9AGAM|nr:hypothetical protein FA95DRAFT_1608889 [Auriscalpium vulgare]